MSSARLVGLKAVFVTDARPAIEAYRPAPAPGLVARLHAKPDVRADCLWRCCCHSCWRSRSIAGTPPTASAWSTWLKAIGELEALAAIGTYAYEHATDPFPTLDDRGPVFEARPARSPVDGRSGRPSAMTCHLGGGAPRRSSSSAGRTCRARARCCGRSASTSCWRRPARRCARAALRLSAARASAPRCAVEDSLQAGHSRFYAEILRIRDIVAVGARRRRSPLLFLLDEILHGTNSHDRRIGAEAIVRALAGLGAIGLVTTHDLALTELPDDARRDRRQHAFRGSPGRRADGLRLPHARRASSSTATLALMRAVGLEV